MIKNSINDFDIWAKAVNKIDMTEAAVPFVNGKALIDESEVEIYNKIQKLLNSKGMESSHKFLYSLDPSDLTESEISKVNNLYKLGQQHGFINSVDEEIDEDSEENQTTNECDIIQQQNTTPTSIQNTNFSYKTPIKQSAYTVIYSATRDGDIKTGEAYSNCINTRSAKADIISKLEKAGYQNITILAIEAGDPDKVGCDNTYYKQPITTIPDYSCEVEETDKTNEADDLDPMSHALDPIGIKASSATMKANNVAATSIVSDDDKDDSKKTVNEEDDKKDDSATDKKDDKEKTENNDTEKKSDDSKKDDNDDNDDADEKKEDVEEPDEKLKDKDDNDSDDTVSDEKDTDELTAEEKLQLKDSYKKAFKAALQKCKFKTSFSELTLEQKVQFFTELSKAWGDKVDPSKFMSNKEIDQLEKIIVNKA